MLKGRQILKLVDTYCRGSGLNSQHLLLNALSALNLRDENVEKFHDAWCNAMEQYSVDGINENMLRDLLFHKMADVPVFNFESSQFLTGDPRYHTYGYLLQALENSVNRRRQRRQQDAQAKWVDHDDRPPKIPPGFQQAHAGTTEPVPPHQPPKSSPQNGAPKA